MDSEMFEAIERARLATFPPLDLATNYGLLVGASRGATGRANSALALGPLSAPVDQAVEWATSWLQDRDLAPLFRVSPLTPPELIATLDQSCAFDEARNHTDTMCLHLQRLNLEHPDSSREQPTPATDNKVTITSKKPTDWITERDTEGASEVEALMDLVEGHVGWAVIRSQHTCADSGLGKCLAVGRGVVAGQWLCIQAMFTAPEARGQGLARSVLDALHQWGRGHGATDAFLDVLITNVGAQALYTHFGYEAAYQYHYVGAPSAAKAC